MQTKNTDLKIAFFGTSDRSVPILEALNENFNLSLCVTKKDTLVGRKKEVRQTAVKKWAKKHNIDVFELENLKEPASTNLIEQLKYSNIDYGIVADFSMIIPESIIEYFNGRLINIHFSKLPKYRGASPVQFAILNGDQVTGITYQLIHKELDKGGVLETIEYKLSNNKTSGEVYEDMFQVAAQNLPKVLREFSLGKLTIMPQDENLATYTYSPTHPKRTTIFKEDAKINWNEPVKNIERSIRAYNPWPIAWTKLKELEETPKVDINLKDQVDRKLTFKIYSAKVENGKLVPEIIQIEGKSKMNWNDFKNGYENR